MAVGLILLLLWQSQPTVPSSSETDIPSSQSLRRVGIIDQLDKIRQDDFIPRVSSPFKGSRVRVNIHAGTAVNVELLRMLPSLGYELIVMRAHMGVGVDMPDGSVGILTNEPYSKTRYLQEQLADRLGAGQAFPDSPVVFAVGSKFIRDSMEGRFPGTVIILSGCYGLKNYELANALTSRGASLVLSWTGLVSNDYADSATIKLVEALVAQKLPVQQAIERVESKLGRDSNNPASHLKLYPDSVVLWP